MSEVYLNKMTEKQRQKILINNYKNIRKILNDYKYDKIGIQEAMYCMCGIIEIILKNLNKNLWKKK